jgi:hypothetical protein
LPETLKLQAIGNEILLRVGHQHRIDPHLLAVDQLLALAPGADALRLQDAKQLHGRLRPTWRWQRRRKEEFDAVSHGNPGILWKREIVTFCPRLEGHG